MILDLEEGLRRQRSYLLFKSVINSEKTLMKYDDGLTKFMNRFGYTDYESILQDSTDTIQKKLEDYVMELKKRNIKRSTIKGYLQPIELFLEVNKKLFYKKALHMHYPKDSTKSGNDIPYSNEDVLKMLDSTRNKRAIALIHFFGSTGARPNTINDPVLRFRHVTPMPLGCKAVLLYSGSNEEYWAFLTPEASKALNDYIDFRIHSGEKITKDSPVFVSREKQGKYSPDSLSHLNTMSLHSLFLTIVKKAKIERFKTGVRFDKGLFLGFRKRFNTILKIDSEVNSNIAEKLMAHKRGLDGVYFKPTKEDCYNEFIKAIPQLTVNESERLKIKITSIEEDKDKQIAEYERRLSNIEILLSHIKK